MANPEIFVIAGPNGAGKSTAAATILPAHFPTDRFLNADQLRLRISDFGLRNEEPPPLVVADTGCADG